MTQRTDPRLVEIWRLVRELAGAPPSGTDGAEAGADALLDDTLAMLRHHEAAAPLQTFFDEARDGFFFMMLDEPVGWGDESDKEKVLDYVFEHQRVTRANRALLEQYGATEEDFIGKTPADLFSHDVEQGRQAWHRLFDAGVLETRTHEQRTNGEKFWVHGTYVALYDAQGRIVGHIGTQRDVSREVSTLDALARSEARLAEAQRVAQIGLWDWNVQNNDLHWSDEVYRIFGVSESSDLTYENFLAAVHPDDVDMVRHAVDAALEGATYSIEHRLVRKDGAERWLHERGAVSFDQGGKPVRMLGTVQDITDRKHADLALRQALALNAGIVNASPIGIALYRANGECLEANEALVGMIGASREQALAQNLHRIGSWRASGLYDAAIEVLEHGTQRRCDVEVRTTFGTDVSLDCQLVPLEVAAERRLLLMAEDITERKLGERRLEASLHEKEVLLQEIHHRVKNNLQIIKSLLHLQQAELPGDATSSAFQESMDRIQVLALLHERLYQSENLASISLSGYVDGLLESLAKSYLTSDRGITLDVHADELALHVDRAIPLGLLLTEVVSNAIKHGYPGGRRGAVRVEGYALESGSYRVVISDDGVGLPKELDVSRAPTLGLRLVRNLARQLGAKLDITADGGTRYELVLPPSKAT